MDGLRSPLVTRRTVLTGAIAVPAFALSPFASVGAVEPTGLVPGRPLTADQILSVADFEDLARAALPPAHFGFLATGVESDRTVSLNHDAYSHLAIRSRRLIDVSHVDMSTTVFGTQWPTPIYLSAVSSMRAFHPEGEVAVGRAAASRSAQLIRSSQGDTK
jgi:4-hydroxymandelate oxidase